MRKNCTCLRLGALDISITYRNYLGIPHTARTQSNMGVATCGGAARRPRGAWRRGRRVTGPRPSS
eukprot:3487326-Pleurochrysis_carterae.AAC.1